MVTKEQETEGREWAKHNFSKVDMCQAIGCAEPATWMAIPNNETDPHIPGTTTCDAHLVEVGLTVCAAAPNAEHWLVYPISAAASSSATEH